MTNGATGQPGSSRLGEVVESSTTVFTSQCYRLYEAPPLGSLVRCGDAGAVFGMVFEVATRSMDPSRRPIPRGAGEDTEEAVYLSNPQLNRLLVTEFQALVVGHESGGELRPYLAPLPPRIHSFVYRCDDEELRRFSRTLDFMSIVLSAPIPAPDDVIASFLRQAGRVQPEPEEFLVYAGKEMAGYLAGQPQRLGGVLRRLST